MKLDILDSVEQALAPTSVGIEQFAEDTKYCNKYLYPSQCVLLKLIFLEEMTGAEEDILTSWIQGGRGGNELGLSPNIRERRDFLRENGYKHFREVQFVGGRRSSKGFVTGLAMAYSMYNTLMLGDPGGYYGIDKEKDIYFSCIAGSEDQAKAFQYADLVSTVETCKAFDPYLVKSLETEFRVATNADLRKMSAAKARGSKIMRDIAKLRGKALAANAGTLRGSTTMAAAQPLDTQILTPTGWTTMGNLRVGDSVIGGDGMAQTVVKLHPRGIQPVYCVTFSDGSFTYCSDDHLWNVRQKRTKVHTLPLCELREDIWKENGKQGRHAKWALPQAPVVQFDSRPLPLDPYLIGALLGDGNFSGRNANFYTVEPDIADRVQEVLPGGHILVKDPDPQSIRYRITNPYDHRNDVVRGLRELELLGHKASTKFIPDVYKQALPSQRLALLQGLLDTDGMVFQTSVRFGVTSYRLAQDVVEIVRSLGGYATMSTGITNTGGYGGDDNYPLWMVCISGLDATTLFRSQRKLGRASQYRRYKQRLRRIVRIDRVEDQEVQCITVSNLDGLYITDRFLITHNCVDEMAHMLPGESKASADQVYTALDPSLDQFGLDGIMFLNSSPYTKVGMFYVCYEANMRHFDPTMPVSFVNPMEMDSDDLAVSNGNPRNFAFQFASWTSFENYRYYKSKYKPKERGKEFGKMVTVSPDWDPEELDEQGRPKFSIEDKGAILQARAKEAANPESYKVERRGKFAEVTDAYLNPSMVDQMYMGIPGGLQEKMLPNGGVDYVRTFAPIHTNHGEGATYQYRYKFHVDPSSTTAGFGFAIGHIEYFTSPVTGMDEEHVVFDLIKRWDPANFNGKVIRWKPILQEILTYATMFRPFEITFDQHQSLEPIQDLQDMMGERNIQCRVWEKTATNELNWKRWEVFKTALYANLVHAPFDEFPNPSPMGSGTFTSKDELKFLQVMPTGGKYPRVEKQDIGPVQTKDMADCVAEVVYTLIGNLHITTMRERLANSALIGGSPHGYGIGQGGPIGGPGPPGISGYYSRREEKMAQMGGNEAFTRGAIGMQRRRRGQRSRGRW